MPTERTSPPVADDDAQRAIPRDGHAEVRAALDGDLARETRFWRARAEELAAQTDALQKRLLALADRLPARWLPLLTCDPAALRREVDWPDPLAGWKETTILESASVATELGQLWKRLGSTPR